MASGLFALLDDVAAIAKLAAASIDDVGAAAARAGAKAAGVVVDDTAVTPRYVHGFSPKRELPIIARIAKGSIVNKLAILLPAAMLLTALLPWAITPLLMLGGAYLCFEGVEKLIEAITPHDEAAEHPIAAESADVENEMVRGAVRTDFILSAEIMAIALSQVDGEPLLIQAAALALVAVAITAGVYGAVGLIVKMDDIGLHLAGRGPNAVRALGRGLVHAMPVVMRILSVVGVAAMIWVGGGILVHGLEVFHLAAVPHLIHGFAERAGGGFAGWLVSALGSGLVGIAAGAVIVGLLHILPFRRPA